MYKAFLGLFFILLTFFQAQAADIKIYSSIGHQLRGSFTLNDYSESDTIKLASKSDYSKYNFSYPELPTMYFKPVKTYRNGEYTIYFGTKSVIKLDNFELLFSIENKDKTATKLISGTVLLDEVPPLYPNDFSSPDFLSINNQDWIEDVGDNEHYNPNAIYSGLENPKQAIDAGKTKAEISKEIPKNIAQNEAIAFILPSPPKAAPVNLATAVQTQTQELVKQKQLVNDLENQDANTGAGSKAKIPEVKKETRNTPVSTIGAPETVNTENNVIADAGNIINQILAGLAGLLVVSGWAYFYWKRRKQGEVVIPMVEPLEESSSELQGNNHISRISSIGMDQTQAFMASEKTELPHIMEEIDLLIKYQYFDQALENIEVAFETSGNWSDPVILIKKCEILAAAQRKDEFKAIADSLDENLLTPAQRDVIALNGHALFPEEPKYLKHINANISEKTEIAVPNFTSVHQQEENTHSFNSTFPIDETDELSGLGAIFHMGEELFSDKNTIITSPTAQPEQIELKIEIPVSYKENILEFEPAKPIEKDSTVISNSEHHGNTILFDGIDGEKKDSIPTEEMSLEDYEQMYYFYKGSDNQEEANKILTLLRDSGEKSKIEKASELENA